jgi:hypothetical protein
MVKQSYGSKDMTWAPVALAVVSTAMSAYSAVQQSSQTKAAYNYQAGVDKNNAMIANWNAEDAARRGESDLIAQQRKTAAIMGTQRATLAGRGISLEEGSALNILSDTAYLGEQDALTVKDNTAKNVWAAKVQANNENANAGLHQMQADNQNPLMAGATSLLTGAGKVADSFYKYSDSKPSTGSSPAVGSTAYWKGKK